MTSVAAVLFAVFVALSAADRPRIPRLPEQVIVADLFMLGAAIAWAVALPFARARRMPEARLLVPLAVYVLWIGISTLHWSVSPWVFLGACELAAVFVVMASLASDPLLRARMIRVWIWSAAGYCAIALAALALARAGVAVPIQFPGGAFAGVLNRAQGICRSPGLLANFCLVPWILLLDAEERWVRRPWRGVLLAVLTMGCLLTLSRTLLAMGLAAGIYKRRARWVLPAVVALLLVSIRFNLARPGAFPDLSLEPGIRWRIVASALSTAAGHPILGIGPDGVIATASWPSLLDPPGEWRAHLTALDIAARAGVPALLAFAALIAAAARRVRGGVLSIAITAMLFDSLSVDLENFRHFWVFLGLLAAGASDAPGGSPARESARELQTASNQ